MIVLDSIYPILNLFNFLFTFLSNKKFIQRLKRFLYYFIKLLIAYDCLCFIVLIFF